MTTPLAPQLAAYHRLVLELSGETERLHGVPEEMRAVHDEYTAAQEAISELAAEADAAKHERIAREGAIADAQEKLRKFQQQVSRVRNQREYGALLAEIDGAKAQLKDLEEGMLELLERAEATEAALAERRAGFGDLEERHAAALADWESKKPGVAARVAELERQVTAAKEELSRPIVAQYVRLAERYGSDGAVTSLTVTERAGGALIWHCSSCNYHVRPQLALEIRTHGKLVQCDGCRRFLLDLEGS